MSRRANGEGTIYQRADGRYEAAVFVPTLSGTRKRVRVYGRTREEARRKLTALQRQVDQGVPVSGEVWSVEQYLTYWLASVVKPRRRPKTYQGYEGVVRLHLVPGLGRKRLDRLSARDVRVFLGQLANEKHLSTRSVQFVHAVLRNALQNAMREELIVRNVAALVQVATPTYGVGRGLSVEQARKLLGLAREDRLHTLYVLALLLGLRRGELLGLRWQDVDLDAASLTVAHALQRVEGELRLVPPKTVMSARTVPLPGLAVEALRTHWERQAVERTAAGSAWRETGLVFVSSVGTPLEPDNLRRSWHPLRQALGEPVRLHDLRHTAVSLLLDLGVPPHVVREIVGHADLGVTMTIYAHAALEEKRQALARLDAELR